MNSKTFHNCASRRAVQKSIEILKYGCWGRLFDKTIVIRIRIEDESPTKISKERMIVVFMINGIGNFIESKNNFEYSLSVENDKDKENKPFKV